MYPVSANFHTLAIQDAPKTRVRIYFIGDAVDCTDDNDVQTNGTLLKWAVGDTDSNGRIGQNGVVFNEMFNPDKNIQIGRAVSSQIGMTLLNTDGALENFQYGRCKVYLDVYDSANSAWLACPMGVYIIELPTKRKVQLINAVGFDQMTKLDAICDTWWNGLNWSGGLTLLQIVNSMATQLGVSVSSNTASAIVNSSLTYTAAPFDCVEVTYREVLEVIAEATGTVARFDRDGALDLRYFDVVGTSSSETYTGTNATFTSDSGATITSLSVPFIPIQSGSGDPSPDNVRPITGWTGLNVYDDPKYAGTIVWNQLEPCDASMYTSTAQASLSLNGTTYSLTSNSNSTVYKNARRNCLTVGHKYFLSSILTTGTNPAVIYQGANTNSISSSNGRLILSSGNESNILKSTIFESEYVCLVFRLANAARSGDVVYFDKVQLFDLTEMFGSNIADYVYGLEQANAGDGVAWFKNLFPQDYYSYNAGTETCVSAVNGDPYWKKVVDWTSEAGTVYGGTVDLVSGVLTVDKANIPSYNGETINEPWLSSMDVYSSGTTPTTGAQVVYTLASPVTYQLIPQDIAALTGQNCVWATNGETVTVQTLTITPITINTDTVGNQCLSIDVAEYSVSKIDLLRAKFAEGDLGVTVGSGTNEYVITNNLFLNGANTTDITNKITPIYNRLNGLAIYNSVNAKMIWDWSIEAGDVVYIVRGGTTYYVLIFQQTMTWRGGYVVSDLICDGDKTRPVLDSATRDYYRLDSDMRTLVIEADRINLLGYTTINNGFKVNLDGTFEANGATINGAFTSSDTVAGVPFSMQMVGSTFSIMNNANPMFRVWPKADGSFSGRVDMADNNGNNITVVGAGVSVESQINGGVAQTIALSVQGTDPNNRGVLNLFGVKNNRNVSIRLDPTGGSTFGNSFSNSDVTVYGNVSATGDSAVGGDLSVAGAASMGGDATVGGDLSVTGTINSIGIEQFNITAGSSRSVILANSTANCFIISGSTTNLRTMIITYTTAAGATSYTMDPAASSITVTTATNSITIASTGYVRVMHFTF